MARKVRRAHGGSRQAAQNVQYSRRWKNFSVTLWKRHGHGRLTQNECNGWEASPKCQFCKLHKTWKFPRSNATPRVMGSSEVKYVLGEDTALEIRDDYVMEHIWKGIHGLTVWAWSHFTAINLQLSIGKPSNLRGCLQWRNFQVAFPSLFSQHERWD